MGCASSGNIDRKVWIMTWIINEGPRFQEFSSSFIVAFNTIFFASRCSIDTASAFLVASWNLIEPMGEITEIWTFSYVLSINFVFFILTFSIFNILPSLLYFILKSCKLIIENRKFFRNLLHCFLIFIERSIDPIK